MDSDLLMYNPVPKTGSKSMAKTLESLSKRNGFTYQKWGDRGNYSRQYSRRDQEKFLGEIWEKDFPLAVNRHIHFVNFSDGFDVGEERNPVYINYLRDPIGKRKFNL